MNNDAPVDESQRCLLLNIEPCPGTGKYCEKMQGYPAKRCRLKSQCLKSRRVVKQQTTANRWQKLHVNTNREMMGNDLIQTGYDWANMHI